MKKWMKYLSRIIWGVALLLAGCRSIGQVAAPPPATSLAVPEATAMSSALAPAVTRGLPVKTTAAPAYWPTDGWRSATPKEQGMDGEKLAQVVEQVRQRRLNLHSLLVIRHGYQVSENYFGGYTAGRRHELYSCTKSFVATLVGMAVERGIIAGIDQNVLAYFPDETFANPDPRKAAMTLEDLLTMTSGLDWVEGDPVYRALYLGDDWVKYMLDLPMREAPGEQFNYCSGCSHLLSAVVQGQSGMATADFAEKVLFEPLGIQDYRWDTDAQGISIGGWGLQLAPREMAKLGYLYLHQGMWDGEQILPATWVQQATRQHVASDAPGRGYGYQWWTYPSLAAYMALGRGGQMIFVIPGLDLIVVTTAEGMAHEELFRLVEEGIVPAVK
jgi:CubicO group peptidase (beta-lactamase class C family)